MARILVIRGDDEIDYPLRNCLENFHECFFVSDSAIALKLLARNKFDAVICSAYYSAGDVYAFIRRLKRDDKLRMIPLICVTCERSSLASRLDRLTATTAVLMGADAFFSLDEFCDQKDIPSCKSCTKPLCNLSGLRNEIEKIIERTTRQFK